MMLFRPEKFKPIPYVLWLSGCKYPAYKIPIIHKDPFQPWVSDVLADTDIFINEAEYYYIWWDRIGPVGQLERAFGLFRVYGDGEKLFDITENFISVQSHVDVGV